MSKAEMDRLIETCEIQVTARPVDPDRDAPEAVAWDRAETDYCERGTQGCSVLHTRDSECETW
jgi:hypothetical protein